MSGVHQYRFWSVTKDCHCVRLSMVGADGIERFIMLNDDLPGHERRRNMAIAIDVLVGAVRQKLPPGEITVDFDNITLAENEYGV